MTPTDTTNASPNLNISIEEALSMLLASIASFKASLSRLINLMAEESITVIGADDSIQDIADFNRNIGRVLEKLVHLQVLLQYIIENIIKLSDSLYAVS